MDPATGLQTAFAAQAPPTSALNASGRLLRPPASLFDCLWCETNGNHFTKECRNLQRLANCMQPKVTTSKGKPQQAKVTDAAPAEFAGEASHVLSLTTNHSWNPDTKAMVPHDAAQSSGSPITEPIGSLCG
jgi:hypothetical protein